MSDYQATVDVERQPSKHLSCRQLREQLEGDCDDDTTAMANAKRILDQKGFTAPYLEAIRNAHRFSFYIALLTLLLTCIMGGFYMTILWREYKQDGKIYISTIVGVICAVIHFIITCTNVAPSLAYDKFHLDSILWAIPIIITLSFIYIAYSFMIAAQDRSSLYMPSSILFLVVIVLQGLDLLYLIRIRDHFKPIPESLRGSVVMVLNK